MLSNIFRYFGIYRIYSRYLKNQISKSITPKHIGIILDGNRRWAEDKMAPSNHGHIIGAKTAKYLLDWCHELGIEAITIYVLSTENLKRSKNEVKFLFSLIEEKLKELLTEEKIHKYKVRVKGIGNIDLLPQNISNLLSYLEKQTSSYKDHFMNIAIAYGGRFEILESVKKIAKLVKNGEIEPSNITFETIEQHLYTSHLPNQDVDLIIRTSGEERLSGFLIWQSAYSEHFFLDVYWPSFRKIDLMRALRTYQRRSRRLGI